MLSCSFALILDHISFGFLISILHNFFKCNIKSWIIWNRQVSWAYRVWRIKEELSTPVVPQTPPSHSQHLLQWRGGADLISLTDSTLFILPCISVHTFWHFFFHFFTFNGFMRIHPFFSLRNYNNSYRVHGAIMFGLACLIMIPLVFLGPFNWIDLVSGTI